MAVVFYCDCQFLTLAELQSPSIRIVLNENTRAVTNFRISTLDEALQTAKQCGIHIYIDIKGRSYLEELVADAMARADAFDYVLQQQSVLGFAKYGRGMFRGPLLSTSRHDHVHAHSRDGPARHGAGRLSSQPANGPTNSFSH
jgi:glycerophosphoryl diester phosphodiesterase